MRRRRAPAPPVRPRARLRRLRLPGRRPAPQQHPSISPDRRRRRILPAHPQPQQLIFCDGRDRRWRLARDETAWRVSRATKRPGGASRARPTPPAVRLARDETARRRVASCAGTRTTLRSGRRLRHSRASPTRSTTARRPRPWRGVSRRRVPPPPSPPSRARTPRGSRSVGCWEVGVGVLLAVAGYGGGRACWSGFGRLALGGCRRVSRRRGVRSVTSRASEERRDAAAASRRPPHHDGLPHHDDADHDAAASLHQMKQDWVLAMHSIWNWPANWGRLMEVRRGGARGTRRGRIGSSVPSSLDPGALGGSDRRRRGESRRRGAEGLDCPRRPLSSTTSHGGTGGGGQRRR